MPQNFYELVWIFIIYAFFGWCTEVSYAALDTGKFVNRGFLSIRTVRFTDARYRDCGNDSYTFKKKIFCLLFCWISSY